MPELLTAAFNQDYTCVAVGSQHGYSIYNCDPFQRVYTKADGPTALVEMLFCTSLVTIVTLTDERNRVVPRRLQIVNTKSTICELVFPSAILGVRLNRRRLVAVLDAALHIYDISNMKILHAIDTGPNPKGLCAMTSSSEPCYAAYPADVPSERGGPASSVVIYNLDEFAMVNVVHAHRARIAFLALNAAGTMLATASEKGTVVRVFSVPDGRLLHQFRRGSYPACIRCITFNAASTLLCVTSDSDTVHLFRLAVPRTDALATLADKQRGTLLDLCKRQSAALGRGMAGSLSGYLPSSFTEMWEPTRDFAWLKLPTQGIAASAAISNASPLVMVLTTTGYFCTYSVDLDRGGECSLIKRTHAVAN